MQRPARPDVVLPAHYRMVCEIGRGGMATVYLAHDGRHERPVAVKVLRPDVSAAVAGDRFLREIRVAAGLQHPYVLPVFDSGTATNAAGDGLLWYAMPYVDGENLATRLRRDPPLTLDESLSILRCIADALAHAHERRVVHRDIKPENVLLSGTHALVADFGIAKAVTADRDSLTGTGLVIGTPAYMAPEQAAGDPAADHRVDIYALGAVAYEMLTGSELFPGLARQELMHAQITREPTPLTERRPDLPAGVVRFVERCLQKRPADRWPGAAALREELDALRRGPALSTAPPLADWRAASTRGEWSTALETLRAIDARGGAGAEELEALAEAEWWKGHGAESIAARERAYAAFIAEANPRGAARSATRLAEDWFDRRARAVGHGWLQRAERHLAECDADCAERGWLLRLRVRLALDSERDYERAAALAREAIAIARRTGDRALEAISIQDEGRALIALGRTAAGLPLIDEAMAAAMTGQLDLQTTGRTYCNMMGVCELLADYSRAREWTAAASRWAEPHGESAFPGICRVRRAGLLRLEGRWAEAEDEARRASEELREMLPEAAGAAYYELGEVRLRRGDLPGAAAMFAAAHELGHAPVPGLALLRLAEGRTEAAAALITRALGDAPPSPLSRARLLPAQVEIALAAGDIERALDAAAELHATAAEHGSGPLQAAAAEAHGRVRLAQGDAAAALAQLREARRLWQDAEMPYETARTRALLARAYAALGDEEHASLETAAARAGRERLGIGG